MRTALVIGVVVAALCASRAALASDYVWERVSDAAPFAPAYMYAVHVAPDGRFIALNPEGTWVSRDGRDWTPELRGITGTQYLTRHVRLVVWQFGGADRAGAFTGGAGALF